MSVKLTDVTMQYPAQAAPVYKNFSAEFEQNKVHVVLGASGSGKTTLLNIVAKLNDYEGEVEGGAVSYVFQDDRLVKNITVSDNLRLVLNGVIPDKKQVNEVITQTLRLAEIERCACRYPDELSGGERKRVAIARAFAYPSQVLLMDEPFNSLDYGVKERLFAQFYAMQNASPRTVLFVTHDVDEAIALADEIYLLQGAPATLKRVATLSDDKLVRDVCSDEFAALKRQIVSELKKQQSNA